jgi:hypothetical protein
MQGSVTRAWSDHLVTDPHAGNASGKPQYDSDGGAAD